MGQKKAVWRRGQSPSCRPTGTAAQTWSAGVVSQSEAELDMNSLRRKKIFLGESADVTTFIVTSYPPPRVSSS